ncbi:hypothetical protein VD0002_g7085 [Verticillium dahliae]|uniref:Subtelomeric hrmA-associated cluster protein AFUB-079030/YDR124W-like helical bundle domain-containing protein n=1 Tax=Verticillium dahliae TaxID=27337 RepID=A0A2J8DHC1_VERDA|nr:hypothetical protein EV126DRAFT_517760 [Verticillium dahliae]PNH32229.1 hypothetical protein BJF96_g4537 [Verticillium dahliae]PNH48657.1 hypothetical protein VD0003_g8461 [Verticillium dahliae]PNH60566.1 hypothetical protein VD0002_g7085 [Verticillium dahliae]RBQ77074.1 hypothetical protein VDGD_06388 [Verticillium dahliae]
MVNVRGDWSREAFPRHQPQWHQHQDRSVETTYDEGRYHELNDTRRPPLDIEKALREHCNIPARHYFVAAILDDGSTQTFSGPGRNHPSSASTFFDMDRFRQQVRRADAGAIGPMHDDPELSYASEQYRQQVPLGYGSSAAERRRQGSEVFGSDDFSQPRKRARAYRRPIDDDSDIPSVTMGPVTKGLKIGDTDEVRKFYDQRFRNCQQTACKLIAKAWVKVVEPKKQTNHPYTGQEEKAPDWWPKPWGTTKEEKVRHKEPDHLYKRERVYLLCHILRMIVEPNEKQHPSIQKMNLTVEKLKEATEEALSMFFSAKENHKNAKKKPYLDEIFKVALSEQRFKHGEIDADTQVFVMAEERFPGAGMSEHDDSAPVKDECEPQSASSTSPSKSTATHDTLMHGSSHDHSPAGGLQGSSYMDGLPPRGGAPYTQQLLQPSMHADQHFVDSERLHSSSGIPMHDIGPGPQDGHRRASIYTSPTEYANPQSAGIYNQSWQPGTTAPGPASIYPFSSTPTPPSQFNNHAGVPLAQTPFIAAQYDGLSRGNFEQGGMFPSGTTANQGHVQGSQGFPTYTIGHDGRSMSNAGVKSDTLPRLQ